MPHLKQHHDGQGTDRAQTGHRQVNFVIKLLKANHIKYSVAFSFITRNRHLHRQKYLLAHHAESKTHLICEYFLPHTTKNNFVVIKVLILDKYIS